ncbi:unnamed protein product [Vicia faba]|uniref:Uncharacterized protein n=1 Tax=Vicia faba TaxID=3906 RepID=A0AAV0ZZM6_VICFA|nr:unnamed protein product [Vicia faba]
MLWKVFLTVIRHRFSLKAYEDVEGVLSKLSQTTLVVYFQAQFEDLMNKNLSHRCRSNALLLLGVDDDEHDLHIEEASPEDVSGEISSLNALYSRL